MRYLAVSCGEALLFSINLMMVKVSGPSTAHRDEFSLMILEVHNSIISRYFLSPSWKSKETPFLSRCKQRLDYVLPQLS